MNMSKHCSDCGADVSYVQRVTVTCPACLKSNVYPMSSVYQAAPTMLAALIRCHDAILAMQTRIGKPQQYEDVRLEARTAITQVEKGGN